MNKRKIAFIALVVIGICVVLAAVWLFFFSLGISDNSRGKVVGLTAVALVPCGALIIALGIICKKKESKLFKLGVFFCAIGGVISLFSIVLSLFAILTIIKKGSVLWLFLAFGGDFVGAGFVLTGCTICEKKKLTNPKK